MNLLSKAPESCFEVSFDDREQERPMIRIVINRKCILFFIILLFWHHLLVYTKLKRPPGAVSPFRCQSIHHRCQREKASSIILFLLVGIWNSLYSWSCVIMIILLVSYDNTCALLNWLINIVLLYGLVWHKKQIRVLIEYFYGVGNTIKQSNEYKKFKNNSF